MTLSPISSVSGVKSNVPINNNKKKKKKKERKKKTSNILQPKEPGLPEIDSSSSKQVRISTNGLTITLLKAH
jgi:hypothetical protein